LHKPPEPAAWIVHSVLVFNPASRAREDQMRGSQKASLFIAALAVVATAACGNRSSSDGDDLSTSLELAPRGGSSQAVVSAIEAGPTAAPTHAAHKPVAKPGSHPAPLRAAPQQVAPAPKAAVVEAPQQPAAQPQKQTEPDPLPPFPDAQGAGKERQRGKYGTEADIFRRMPWIRP